MSRQARIGLAAARFGLYVLMAVSAAVGSGALTAPRLGSLFLLLAGLSFIGYALMASQRIGARTLVLLLLEIALLFAVGMLAPRSPWVILYFIAAADATIFGTLYWPATRTPFALALAVYLVAGMNLYLVDPEPVSDYVTDMLSILVGFVFTVATSRLAIEQMIARQRTESLLAELEATHGRLAAYAAEVETLSVARERQRVAQEVHDSVAHVLTGLLVQLQAVRKTLGTDPQGATSRLASLEEVVRRGLDEVRRAVRAMRPELLETVGGIEAMRRLSGQFAERTGIGVSFVTESPPPLTPVQEVLLYRTLQECLTNAARHGRASNVWATVRTRDGSVELRVRDDGAGAHTVEPGMGLSGMKERAHTAGGRFTYGSAAGEGFEALLQLPVTPTPARA